MERKILKINSFATILEEANDILAHSTVNNGESMYNKNCNRTSTEFQNKGGEKNCNYYARFPSSEH